MGKSSRSKYTPDQARKALQSVGLRRTASRIAVLCELAAAEAPLTHAEMVTRLEPTGFGAPTIFRCLADLTEVGLISRFDMGDHVWRFGFPSGHAEDAGHPHFLCVDCGSATCLPGVDIRISSKSKQEIGDVTEVVLKGHCPNCR